MIDEPVGHALGRRSHVPAVGPTQVVRHPVPVGDLGTREQVGFVVGDPACERIAMEVLELRRELADDARLARGLEVVK